MSTGNRPTKYDSRQQRALADLQTRIRAQYPSTVFSVRAGIDDPEAMYLIAIVDVDDPDVVLDLVADRVLELQLDEGLPVYVLPIHTPERVRRTMHEISQRENAAALLPPA